MDNSLCTASTGKTKIIYREQIGQGSFGEVWVVEWNGSIAAAKRIHKTFFEKDYDQEIKDQRVSEFMKECEVLRTLDHENIVKMIDVLLPANKSPVIIMELMHCDLRSYIKKSTSTPKVSPDNVVSIALGVAKGLEYLHRLPKPIIHRDLASKNILLTKDGQPKIADLGVAKILLSSKDDTATPKPGTLLYAAPETYKNVKNYSATYGVAADIFSFGVVLLELNVGHEPCPLPLNLPGKTTEIRRRQREIDEMQDQILKRLVIDCLQEKSSKRPSARQIVIEIQRIKNERESQRAQSTQPVRFERLHEISPLSCGQHFKVLLLGNRFVGKTSLFGLLRNPTYDIGKTESTVHMQKMKHYFEYNDNSVEMEIVDTAGEEHFFSLTSSYYRDVDGVFLVYDVSDQVSLQSLRSFWIGELKKYNRKDNVQMLLVGNKVDLRHTGTEQKGLVPQEKAIEYSKNINSPHVETSAKDIDSVTAMYQKMVELLMSTVRPEAVNDQVNNIRLPSSPSQNNPKLNKCSCNIA